MNKIVYSSIVFYLLLLCTPMQAQTTVTEVFNDRPLSEVFNIFADKYNLLLAYEEEVVADQTIRLNFRGEEITTALYRVLDQAQLDYFTLDERQILIRAKAQQTAPATVPLRHVQGRITDKADGQGLAFATVLIAGTNLGVAADAEGYYLLSWPDTLGTALMIEARYLGYDGQQKAYRAPAAYSQQKIDFALAASTQSLGIIIVTDQLPTLSLSAKDQAIALQASRILPGLGGQADLLRTIQLLPGVAAFNDRSATLNVRGSQADENMINWDGMLLYQVDHFFGAFGAVNTLMVESSKLYKNNFPINYGGRTGAILAIQSPQTIDQSTTTLQLGSLMLEGHSQLSLARGMSLQLGARSTFNNIAKTDLFGVLQQEVDFAGANIGLAEGSQTVHIQPNFAFYDLNAKWTWKINDDSYLDANYYRSADDYHYDYSQSVISRRFNRFFNNTATFGEQSQWQNEALSLRWQQQWNDKLEQQWTIGHSTYSIAETTTSILKAERAINSFTFLDSRITRANDIQSFHADFNNRWFFHSNSQLNFGGRIIQEKVVLRINNDSLTVLQNDSQATQLAAYTSWQAERGPWNWAVDLHTTYYTATKGLYWSPRLRAGLRLNDEWQLKAAVNQYYQFLRAYYHENRFGRSFTIWSMADDLRFPVAESLQGMLGFTFSKEDFRLDAEFFIKNTQGVLEHTSILNGFQQDTLGNLPNGSNSFIISEGSSEVIGLDLLIRQEWGRYDTWLSYTWSRSRRQFDNLFRGEPYAAQDDRPHQLNWVNTYQQGPWSCSAVYVFASGRPYLDLSSLALEPDRRLRSPSSLERIAPYHRLDLSLKREWVYPHLELFLSAAVYNVFNRQNSLYNQQIYKITQDNKPDILLGNELELMNRSLGISLGIVF
jgi:hypothetical protein